MIKKVVLFGKGSLAVKIADYFHFSRIYELTFVVPVVPEPLWTESLVAWCKNNCVPFVESGLFSDLRQEEKINMGVSVFYDRIFPKEYIERFGKMINIHPGLLPEYRGLNPVNWALKNNEKFHGVTIHEITEKIDSGAVISQVKFRIFPDKEEVEDVYKKSLDFAWTLFLQTIEKIDYIKPVAQDESAAKYHSAKDRKLLGDRREFTRKMSLKKGDGI